MFHYRNINAYTYSEVILYKIVMYAESLVNLRFQHCVFWEGYKVYLTKCIQSPQYCRQSWISFFLISIFVGFQLA